MSPAFANFLFEAVNFLLLTAALGWVLFKPVRRVLDEERAHRDKEDEELKRLRAEAESLTRAARGAREAADRETSARRAEILDAAKKEAARILEEARKAQELERRAAEEEMKTMRGGQAVALAETVGCIAAASVGRLLESVAGPSLDLGLVRAACEELRKLPSSARRAAIVESARPLEAEARAMLEAALGNAFEERNVAELGAGVRITTAAGQVDATALSFARQAARAVSAASSPTRGSGGGDG